MVNRILISSKKKKVKRLSSNSYYPSAFISNPCDQLFGPQPLDLSINSLEHSINTNKETSFNSSLNDQNLEESKNLNTSKTINTSSCGESEIAGKTDRENTIMEKFDYIPAPKWNKTQNSILEDLFKKSRYPKQSELKSFAQRLHVMDSDIEDWFRKRRGRDRKTRRKNEALKNLIDNYLDK